MKMLAFTAHNKEVTFKLQHTEPFKNVKTVL